MSEATATIQNLSYTYLPGTPMATLALRGATLAVRRQEIGALVGESGAGKSTMVHFLNGLLHPSRAGQVSVFGQDTALPDCDLVALRRRVGLVFQYPHHQLFERYVGDDIAYGPRQLGLSRDQVRERVRWAMGVVGLDFQGFVDRQTFSLSGGEMRRAALAGVLAMRPELLVLDEATTGLDPRGREEVWTLLRRLRDEEGTTILLVSNDMDEVAELADHVTVMHRGRTILSGAPGEVFRRGAALRAYGLTLPVGAQIVQALSEGGIPVDQGAVRMAQAEEAIWQAMTA